MLLNNEEWVLWLVCLQTDTLQLRRQWFTGHKCRFWWGCMTEHWNDAVYHSSAPCNSPWRFPNTVPKKKTTIKEGTFFPLINVNNRKRFVKSLPPFHLWVVNFVRSIDVRSPTKTRGWPQRLLCADAPLRLRSPQWGFSLMSNIVTPAGSEDHSHIRISQLAPRLLTHVCCSLCWLRFPQAV